MKVLAAYMLARLGGNTNPSADDLKRILGAVGAEIDGHRIELFLSKVNGKNIDELVASGKEKLASVPSVGDTSAAAPPAVVQETKEEKDEEEEEEEEDDGPDIFDLFGPDN
ncbi:PREDICTED: 60S acidic ribosomal protein P2-4-like [Fragaria vesca subsp. vesca]|uniref:60S acidic ribosomal protein P2-4-like n=1 Tax=Fragaria vesca subsp. vesca TaxID=101020 RepID=UPI0002C363D4|nr:PREDICTED: 60S acidic ribosomal protein P2-4-like [Fragaria vesca subsp. vesca]